MSFKIDADSLLKGLSDHENKMREAVLLYGETAGKKMEAYAKENKPWENRTSNALNSIQGGAESHATGVDVYVSGNMEYSPYLELAHEKQYAILWPTVEQLSPEILKGMKNLMK